MQQQDQHLNIDVHLQVRVLDHSASLHLVDVPLEGVPVKNRIFFRTSKGPHVHQNKKILRIWIQVESCIYNSLSQGTQRWRVMQLTFNLEAFSSSTCIASSGWGTVKAGIPCCIRKRTNNEKEIDLNYVLKWKQSLIVML